MLRQEGWHYEIEDPDAPLTFKGVVYNEMKVGAVPVWRSNENSEGPAVAASTRAYPPFLLPRSSPDLPPPLCSFSLFLPPGRVLEPGLAPGPRRAAGRLP